MSAGAGKLFEDPPEEEPRVRLRPWSSPWSLDDEWDDRSEKGLRTQTPVRQAAPRPRPQPAPSHPFAVPPIIQTADLEQPVPPPPKKAVLKAERPAERVIVARKPTAPLPPSPGPSSKQHQPQAGTGGRPTFAWGTPILMSLGLLGLTFLLWVYWQDVPRETDEDLRLALPVDQQVSITGPRRMQAFLNSITPLANGSSLAASPWQWNTPALAEFVGGNGAAFDNLRDLLEDYDWHPRHSSWHTTDLGADPRWPGAILLLQAQAAYLVRRGDEESAFSTAIDLAEFSRRLQDLWAWPSFAARAHEFHTGCVQTLAELLKRTRLDDERLERFQKEFADCAPSRDVFQNALSAYYIHEKKLLLGRESEVPLDTLPPGIAQRRPGRLFFKMNQTLNSFADAFRELKAEAASPPAAAFSLRRTRQTAPQFYQPNASGERYFSDRIDLYLDLPEKHNVAQARHHLIVCLFAIRRHVADHHKVPDTLAALKPRYLTEVPVDPFSGEGFHYDIRSGRLYSVGTNRIAEGGVVTNPPLTDPKEPTVELGIAAAALIK